jgi:hypothetical protein
MTTATFMDLVTVLVAALLSFAIVDIIKRGPKSRLLSFLAHLLSLARLSLPFGLGRQAQGSQAQGSRPLAAPAKPRSGAFPGRPSPTGKAGRVRPKRARRR